MSDHREMELFLPNGNMIPSSQQREEAVDKYSHVYVPMEGIILGINPSDDPDNLTAGIDSEKSRGYRHECSVLIVDADGEPNLLLENVVIPPVQHSGIDDYDEDLPRKVLTHLDKQQLSENWKHLDISRLDGEHCVISFVGGNVDKPFISNWWPHPANKYDPATSGQSGLPQVDIAKSRSRAMRRTNGVLHLITKDGDIYLDTTEASSQVEITPTYKRQLLDKGGNIQVNVKSSKQLEINWNTSVEGLKAGSNSQNQSREVDLPHIDHAKALAASTPAKRETTKTFVRVNQNEVFQKTNVWTVNCSTVGDKKGQALVLADESIDLYVRKNDDPVNVIHLENNNIQLIASSGTQIDIFEDEISILTKSGGLIYLNGNKIAVSGKVDVSGPMAVGGLTGQPTLLGTTFSTLLSTYLVAENAFAGMSGLAKYFTAIAAVFNGLSGVLAPLVPLAAEFTNLANTCNTFANESLKLNINMPTTMSKNLTTS